MTDIKTMGDSSPNIPTLDSDVTSPSEDFTYSQLILRTATVMDLAVDQPMPEEVDKVY